jgi:ABC-2 type transport system permease protein
VTTLVGAEFLKLRTTRGWIGYLLALVALTAIGTVAQVGSAAELDVLTPEFQRDLVSSSVASLIAFLLGITAVTVEWRHGTITRTLLALPRRGRFVLAKEITAFLAGSALAVLGVAVVIAVAVPMIAADDASLVVDGELGVRIGRVVLAAALWGAFGAGVGALLKSQTFALVAAILWILLAESLLALLFGLVDLEGAADFLPGQALGALDGSVEDALSPAAAGVVGLAYVAGFGLLGWARVERSDIT